MTGEKGNGDGESADEGECESGVLLSDSVLCTGRYICDAGRGMGTPFVAGREDGPADGWWITEVGEEALDKEPDLRCVGCDKGSEE